MWAWHTLCRKPQQLCDETGGSACDFRMAPDPSRAFSGGSQPDTALQHTLLLSSQRAWEGFRDVPPGLPSRNRTKRPPPTHANNLPGDHFTAEHLSKCRGVVSNLLGAVAKSRRASVQPVAVGNSRRYRVSGPQYSPGEPVSALPFAVRFPPSKRTARLLFDLFALARELATQGQAFCGRVLPLGGYICWASPCGDARVATNSASCGVDSESATLPAPVRGRNQAVLGSPCWRGTLRFPGVGFTPD